ncbi:opsin-like receptor [Clonorchis sinensis]|uniref:Opsin-like receptor n=1 Tax=Clonorchis sinensis TaxID=79923 RepID=G7YQS5_CLOSI|nr:opsin-like receptor [Clonorchis sinensis]
MLWPDDPEFFSIVHPYWHKFPVPDPLYHYFVGAYITIMCTTAILGNILVIALFSLCKQLRTPANLLIINLAINDLSFSIINGFPLKTISSINQRWTWGKLACQIYGFIGGVAGFNSLTTNAMIALDRYFVIAQPIQAFTRMSYLRAFVMLAICWIWALLWSVPPFFGIADKKADVEAAKTSIILVSLYLLAWTPYAVVCLMVLLGKMDDLSPIGSELPVLFAKTSAVYNPIVYAIRHPKFRMELEKRFPFLLCCCPPKPKERAVETTVTKVTDAQPTES